MEFIKNHPYLTGFAVLSAVILFLVLRKSGTSSTTTSGVAPADPNVLAAQVQQSQLDAASTAHAQDINAQLQAVSLAAQLQQQQTNATIHIADLNAQATIAAAGIQASSQDAAARYAMEGAAAQFASQSQIAPIPAGGSLSIAQVQASRDTTVAGIQADVTKTQAQDALAAQKDINAATVATNA